MSQGGRTWHRPPLARRRHVVHAPGQRAGQRASRSGKRREQGQETRTFGKWAAWAAPGEPASLPLAPSTLVEAGAPRGVCHVKKRSPGGRHLLERVSERRFWCSQTRRKLAPGRRGCCKARLSPAPSLRAPSMGGALLLAPFGERNP